MDITNSDSWWMDQEGSISDRKRKFEDKKKEAAVLKLQSFVRKGLPKIRARRQQTEQARQREVVQRFRALQTGDVETIAENLISANLINFDGYGDYEYKLDCYSLLASLIRFSPMLVSFEGEEGTYYYGMGALNQEVEEGETLGQGGFAEVTVMLNSHKVIKFPIGDYNAWAEDQRRRQIHHLTVVGLANARHFLNELGTSDIKKHFVPEQLHLSIQGREDGGYNSGVLATQTRFSATLGNKFNELDPQIEEHRTIVRSYFKDWLKIQESLLTKRGNRLYTIFDLGSPDNWLIGSDQRLIIGDFDRMEIMDDRDFIGLYGYEKSGRCRQLLLNLKCQLEVADRFRDFIPEIPPRPNQSYEELFPSDETETSYSSEDKISANGSTNESDDEVSLPESVQEEDEVNPLDRILEIFQTYLANLKVINEAIE